MKIVTITAQSIEHVAIAVQKHLKLKDAKELVRYPLFEAPPIYKDDSLDERERKLAMSSTYRVYLTDSTIIEASCHKKNKPIPKIEKVQDVPAIEFVFNGPKGEYTTVVARDEQEGRKLAMVKRWGPHPEKANRPVTPHAPDYRGEGLGVVNQRRV